MGVISMNIWEDIRVRSRAKGESIKSISRSTGVSKNTIKKYLRDDRVPQEAINNSRSSVLSSYTNEICQLIEATPKITSSRIVQVLRERHDLPIAIKERAARLFIAKLREGIVPKEAFIRLVYQPASQIQIDFKDIHLRIDGEAVKHHLFSARLAYSGAFFGKVYSHENAESLYDGILQVCRHFDGVVSECVFDNPKMAVLKVLRGRERLVNQKYASVVGSLGMQMHFAAPASGNEKGGVEGVHGYIEDNHFRPMRDGGNLQKINADLLKFCMNQDNRSGDKFVSELCNLYRLPDPLPDIGTVRPVCINKFSEVNYATNRYSVPSEFAHRSGDLHIYYDHLDVMVAGTLVASHARSYAKHTAVLNPMHYLDILSWKHRAVERAEVFSQINFPIELRELLHAYVEFDRDQAGKNFMRVMRQLEKHSMETIRLAVIYARERGTIDPAAIELRLLQQDEYQSRVRPSAIEIQGREKRVIVSDLSAYAASTLHEELI
jgi:transposase